MVTIDYAPRKVTIWWNKQRKPGEVAIFTGYYWSRGRTEAGPFKSRAACIRDAYYNVVLEREPPHIGSVSRKPARGRRLLLAAE